MLTISQLASCAGCTVKAVRVYHQRGLLPEPVRDAAGYRRYDARAVVDLARIVTVARAGVPLARIPALLAADAAGHHAAVEQVDADLAARIAELEQRRATLALLRTPARLCLPDAVLRYLERLRALGLSEDYRTVERDGWILAAAVEPSVVDDYLPEKAALLDDAEYVRGLRMYDDVRGLDPADTRLAPVIDVLAVLAGRLATPDELAALAELPRPAFAVLTGFRGDTPAWRVVNTAIDERLAPRGR